MCDLSLGHLVSCCCHKEIPRHMINKVMSYLILPNHAVLHMSWVTRCFSWPQGFIFTLKYTIDCETMKLYCWLLIC